jgi:hypothetical protein
MPQKPLVLASVVLQFDFAYIRLHRLERLEVQLLDRIARRYLALLDRLGLDTPKEIANQQEPTLRKDDLSGSGSADDPSCLLRECRQGIVIIVILHEECGVRLEPLVQLVRLFIHEFAVHVDAHR